ncbi:four helix bundle protein [Candidatus Falkowbacteria bacterium]|nr:four helix bundle protein [Candidatus Falkowbacteria bacterium]
MIVDVEDIRAYRNAKKLMVLVHKKIILLLPPEERFGLADHMRRSSKAVCRDIAEGWACKMSIKELKNCLKQAIREVAEMVECFKECKELDYLKSETSDWFIEKYKLVTKQLTNLRKNWRDFSKD